MINRIYGTSDETPRVLIKVKEIPQSGKMAHIKKKKRVALKQCNNYKMCHRYPTIFLLNKRRLNIIYGLKKLNARYSTEGENISTLE